MDTFCKECGNLFESEGEAICSKCKSNMAHSIMVKLDNPFIEADMELAIA